MTDYEPPTDPKLMQIAWALNDAGMEGSDRLKYAQALLPLFTEHDAEQAATIAALCGAAYNRGYREAERDRQRAGDGEGLT